MNSFEILLIPILLLTYGVACYVCGKGDLLNIIVLRMQEITKELEERFEGKDKK